MDSRVMPTAEQDQVVEGSSSTVRPVPDMMSVAPCVWTVTPGKGATAIARHQGGSYRARHGTLGPPHVEGTRRSAQQPHQRAAITEWARRAFVDDDSRQGRIARELSCRLRVKHLPKGGDPARRAIRNLARGTPGTPGTRGARLTGRRGLLRVVSRPLEYLHRRLHERRQRDEHLNLGPDTPSRWTCSHAKHHPRDLPEGIGTTLGRCPGIRRAVVRWSGSREGVERGLQ
jgi:hypothetical protein